jgi:beta-lactam-binding protein with PASTA domain
MDFIRFLMSKIFLKNLLAAILLTVLLVFGLQFYLDSYTNHNDYHLVPELKGKKIDEAEKVLEEREMKLMIIDTVDYNPDYPKYSIVEQNPRKGDKVKLGRKIYVKINSGGYSKVPFPNILGKTERQARTILKTTGFKMGKITKKPYFAEVVLYAMHKNDTLKPGMQVPKNSTIHLIIGDGKTSVESTEQTNEKNGENTSGNNIEEILDNVLGN